MTRPLSRSPVKFLHSSLMILSGWGLIQADAQAALLLSTNAVYETAGSPGTPPQFIESPNSAPAGIVSSTVNLPPADGGNFDFTAIDGAARAINVNGVTAVEADGGYVNPPNGLSELRAEARTQDTIENNTGLLQEYFYDFTIAGPTLAFGDFAGVSDADLGAPMAIFNIEINVNGAPVWFSTATLLGGFVGFTLTEAGTNLNATPFFDSLFVQGYEFDDLDTEVSLGTFADGESFDFEALIEVSVSALPFELGGFAGIGDPGNINNPGLSGAILNQPVGPGPGPGPGPNPVPAPSSLVLCLAGLALLTRRPRRLA